MSVRLLSILVLILISSSIAGQSNRLALVIGNGQYQSARKLHNPVNDARDISQKLRLLGFEVMEVYNADQRGMKQSIDEFGRKLSQADVGLYYYSGHGIQLNGHNYLIPVDANLQSENDAEYDCINTSRVLSKMESAGVGNSIIILDACRNNPFESSWDRSTGNNGLAFMEAPSGSLIAYATAPGKTASDGSGTNGLYTKYLLEYMGNPEYNIMQLFQEVRKKVREESWGDQVPWESTSLENDFFFNQTGIVLQDDNLMAAAESKKSESRKITERFDEIKSNPNCIWVEMEGRDLAAVDQAARTELNGRIMNYMVKQAGTRNMNSLKKAGAEILTEELILNTRRKIRNKRRKVQVLRYLPDTDLSEQMGALKKRAVDYAYAGLDALEERRIADALSNLYRSYSIASSFPGEIEITVDDIPYRSLQTYTRGIMPDIIQNTRVSIVDSSMSGDRVNYSLGILYRDQTVQNADFIYWNGKSWSAKVCANNGYAVVEMFPSYNLKELKIRMQYNGTTEVSFDPFLTTILGQVEDRFQNNIPIHLRTGGYQKIHHIGPEHLMLVERVLEKVKLNDDSYVEDLFTRDGFEVFRQLLIYGRAQFLNIGNTYASFQFNHYTYLRSVPFTFYFRNNAVSFSENLCFEITRDGKINNITFALSDKAIEDIMSMQRWPVESKLQIIHFLENYKTAYALKRYDFIEKIFSDNALIIVGKKLEISRNPDEGKYFLTGSTYEFTQLTKDQYLYRLRKVFDRNEYINIRFEENTVKKRDNHSEVYGINIKQNYFSTTYADQGYLFLMVDVEDAGRPVIYVRSWQPDTFSDGRVINLSDFSY